MKLFKCLNCHSDAVDEIIYTNKIAYRCYACGKILPQAYSMDSRLKFALTKSGLMKHYLVALVMRNSENKILMIDRRAYPFTWSLIMGHMHNGETILDTVKRELMEETNITSDKIRRLFSFDINDRCDTGVLSHHIYAFEVFVDDKALIVLNSEASEAKWLTCKDIQKLPKISNKARMVISKLEK